MRARPSAASQRPSGGLTKLPNVERPEASPGWNGETWELRIDAGVHNAFDSLAQIVAPLLSRPAQLAPTGRIPSHRNVRIFRSGGVGLGPLNGPLGKVMLEVCLALSLLVSRAPRAG